MSKRSGWTLAELLVVIAIVVMLAGILVPSLASARDRARLLGCAAGMHDIYQALMAYTAISDRRLPPFRFYDYTQPSLPAAGHWGGFSQAEDPWRCGTYSAQDDVLTTLNLWTLVEYGSVPAARLICPNAPGQLQGGGTSMFQYSSKFSTYCMRFPYSQDLFRQSPRLAGREPGDLLWVYRMCPGGHPMTPGQRDGVGSAQFYPQIVPLVRIDRTYRIAGEVADEVAWGDGVYDVASDVMLADTFWWQDRSDEPASFVGDVASYPVRAGWCHQETFNVLTGGGAVQAVVEDASQQPVRANSHTPGEPLVDEGPCGAVCAERVWQFFDVGGRL